jgi:hypothetical protein
MDAGKHSMIEIKWIVHLPSAVSFPNFGCCDPRPSRSIRVLFTNEIYGYHCGAYDIPVGDNIADIL